MQTCLILAMFFHVLWTAILYALLTALRAPTVWGLGSSLKAWQGLEPKVSANLSNQFEWPLFFYMACLLVLTLGINHQAYLWLAWLFVFGRVAHSLVQVFQSNLRVRGLVFAVNFIAVLFMWLKLIAERLSL